MMEVDKSPQPELRNQSRSQSISSSQIPLEWWQVLPETLMTWSFGGEGEILSRTLWKIAWKPLETKQQRVLEDDFPSQRGVSCFMFVFTGVCIVYYVII